MAEKTGIAWTDHTWSPWIGCTKVSPGCDGCYAEALDNRHQYGGAKHWGAGVPRYRTKQWDAPMHLNRQAARLGERRTVFPSLCDPFDNEVPEEWRADFFRLVADTPALTWLLLTKRIGNAAGMLSAAFLDECPPNVWVGASVVDQGELDRDLPKLARVPAERLFLSYEPALGRIDWCDAFGIWWNSTMCSLEGTGSELKRPVDWVIIGGESSQGTHRARPFNLEWARHTVRACAFASIPVFVKQLGSRPQSDPEEARDIGMMMRDRAGADPAEWPADLQVQEFPQ